MDSELLHQLANLNDKYLELKKENERLKKMVSTLEDLSPIVFTNCIICGTETFNSSYCSPECASKTYNGNGDVYK